jgi:seryl-tRNA synthetase
MHNLLIILHWLFQSLTVTQIKKLRVYIDDQTKQNDSDLTKHESERNESLKEMGNILHESCIVSNDEVNY